MVTCVQENYFVMIHCKYPHCRQIFNSIYGIVMRICLSCVGQLAPIPALGEAMCVRWIDVHVPKGKMCDTCQVRAKWHYLFVYFASL